MKCKGQLNHKGDFRVQIHFYSLIRFVIVYQDDSLALVLQTLLCIQTIQSLISHVIIDVQPEVNDHLPVKVENKLVPLRKCVC